jgi:AraC family transcriptional regulator
MDKLLLARHNFAWHAAASHYGSATDNQPMDVTIKQQPELRVGTVRHIGPYVAIGRAFERLAALIAGAKRPPNAQLLALYYDDPQLVGANQLRSDAAIAFPTGADVPAGLIERRVPAGKYASTIHTGSYEHLGHAWISLREELARRGLQPTGAVSYEVYLNDPMSVAAGEQRTELFAPIE